MSSYHDLPGEIILEIFKFAIPVDPTGDRIGSKELCNLRLVSKRFDNLASPLLFSTLRLEFGDTDEDQPTASDSIRCQEIIEALATHSTTVFHHTKKLYLNTGVLYCGTGGEDILSARTLVSDKIFDAICWLKNLRIINWHLDARPEREELTIKVVRALSTLSSFQGFEDLHFVFGSPIYPSPSFSLNPFSNLTIFRTHWEWLGPEHFIPEITSLLSRCPKLIQLSLNHRQSSKSENTTLREIFAEIDQLERPSKLQKLELKGVGVTPDDIRTYIHHLKHLTFLEILENPSFKAAATSGGIWTILGQNSIALKGVSTDQLEDPSFLCYLSSYSGLTSLQLNILAQKYGNDESREVVNQIYVQVLPKHAKTLECLKLNCRGLPTKEGLAELIKCQKLTTLQVYLDVTVEALEQGDVSAFKTWFEASLQLSNLTHLILLPTMATRYSRRVHSMFNHALGRVLRGYRRKRVLKFQVMVVEGGRFR